MLFRKIKRKRLPDRRGEPGSTLASNLLTSCHTLLRETFTAKPRRHNLQTHARCYVIRSTRSQLVLDEAKCTGCPRLPSISTTNETKTKINE